MILSASAIAALKACPFRYRNAYALGLRKIEEPTSRRMGNNWHEAQELAYLKPEQPCPRCSNQMHPDKECYICQGTGFVDDPLDAVVRMLNYRYGNLYPGLPRDAAETERVTILYSLFAYRMHYDEQPVKVLAREIPFRLPLIDPTTRKAVPGVVIDGKIDKLVEAMNQIAVMEHKSSSDSVAPDSDFWGHLRLDTQTFIYLYAVIRLMSDGLLEPLGIKEQPIGSVYYDVWHKPQISPKKLSQADTKAFIEASEYFGQKFSGEYNAEGVVVLVDGEPAETEILKSGAPAIRETPDMFGARLFSDIGERPDYYFARRLITRTSEEIERFEWELFNLYQSLAAFKEHNSWYHNEHSCDAYGKCDYCQFCFNGIDLDPMHPPAGFKCIHAQKESV